MPPSDAPDDVPAQINDVQGFGEDEDEYLTEQIIEQANIHVVKAQVQRSFARNRAREAKEDTLKPHEERSRCIIMDYAQNLGLPHFGEEQPGSIYYYSPLAIYITGKFITRK